jgi:hypothetical protein
MKFLLPIKNLKNQSQNKKIIIYCFSITALLSAIISFYLNVNLSVINLDSVFKNVADSASNEYLFKEFGIKTKDGGASSDLETHWQYIQILRENLANLFVYEFGKDHKVLSYPLHHIIISQLPIIGSQIKFYLISFFGVSLFLPVLFYKCLIIRFPKVEKIKLLNVASLVYILPAYQYSAIWGNPHITALFFLLFSIYFFLKLENSNYKITKYFYYSIIFLALAAYTKQFYVFLFPFLLFIYCRETQFILFIKIIIFTFLLSLPGVFFLLKNPILYQGLKQDITNFSSAILISSSIIFFYILPFTFQLIINNYNKIKFIIFEMFKIKYFFFISVLFFVLSLSFYYNGEVGGGIFYRISNIIFKNNYIFFMTSYLGLYLILFYNKKNISNYLLSILLLITFSAGIYIFQKYFEPMFLILFLSFFNNNKIEESISKNNIYISLYFSLYYVVVNFLN